MYIGRFAPSPTGELHFGSLLAALASYLDAKKNNGLWLLRIDDLDPPREQSGASEKIIDTLDQYGLHWDQDIVFQSQSHQHYQQALNQLIEGQHCYPCQCSRKEIIERTGGYHYDKHCLFTPITTNQSISYRFKSASNTIRWLDKIQGTQSSCEHSLHDFVLKRKDELWAYQLAVAVDDHRMGVTNIVRGYDLLPESVNQLALIKTLNLKSIDFAHIPVIKNSTGQKLSKQNLAPALKAEDRNRNILLALKLLGQSVDKKLLTADKSDFLQQAIANWDIKKIPLEFSAPMT
jgi:glutamyl-Q tRNA(Asp) synthetase